MSKQTALEELIDALENNADGRYFLEQYWVNDLLTKQQAERAELIKAGINDFITQFDSIEIYSFTDLIEHRDDYFDDRFPNNTTTK